jgi:CRP-like cAMP-binding protein
VDIAQQLQKSPLFKGIELSVLEALLGMMERQTFAAGERLFRRDDPGDSMYIIVSGQVRIFLEDDDNKDVTFRFYRPGDIFGEFALLDQQPRSTSAAAIEPLEVLVLRRDGFMQLLKERPVIGLTMMRKLAERIRYTTTYLEKVMDWTDLLSKGEYERAVKEITAGEDEESIKNLVDSFLQMVREVEKREQQLKASL